MRRRHGGGGASSSGNRTGNSDINISLTWPMIYVLILFTIVCVIYGWLPEEKLLAVLAFFGIPDFTAFNIVFIIAAALPVFVFVLSIKSRKEKRIKEKIREEERRIQEEKDNAARIEMEKWQKDNAHKYKNQEGPYANINKGDD